MASFAEVGHFSNYMENQKNKRNENQSSLAKTNALEQIRISSRLGPKDCEARAKVDAFLACHME